MYVPSHVKPEPDMLVQFEGSIQINGFKKRQRSLNVIGVVQGLCWVVLGITMFVCLRGVFLLQFRTVAQYQFGKVAGRFAHINIAPKPIFNKQGYITTMVKMRVCEYDGIDGRRLNREWLPILFAQVFEPLK